MIIRKKTESRAADFWSCLSNDSVAIKSPKKKKMLSIMSMSRLDAMLSIFVSVHPHETSALLHSSSCFFFVSANLILICNHSLISIWNFIDLNGHISQILIVSFVYVCGYIEPQILSAYFVVLPLRDEGAISLGLSNLPGLFLGSLALTLVAAPLSTLVFSLPNLSKAKVLFFSQI